MQEIPLELAGPSVESRARQLIAALSQNIYLSPGIDSQWVAHDFYGCKSFIDNNSGGRGSYNFNEQLYHVLGNKLYYVNPAGNKSYRADIPGTGKCLFDDDGTYLYIVTDGKYYQFDPTTNTATDKTPSNAPSPKSLAYLKGFFALDGNNGTWTASDAGDGGTFNGLSTGIANTNSDQIQRIYAFDELYYIYGTKNAETWYFSGTGNLNFTRQEQGVINRGTLASFSIADDGDYMYFLGHDKKIYRLSGSLEQPIDVPGDISKQIETFCKNDQASDAEGHCFTMDGQWFYMLTFPTGDKTFLYSITYDYWTNLSTGMDRGRYLCSSITTCYGKTFFEDYRDGSIHELDRETFADNGEARLRIRIPPPITAKSLGVPGKKQITVGTLYPDIEVGVGLTTGQGVDPVMMWSVSRDGGKTFSEESQVSMGVLGDYDHKPRYDKFSTGYSIVYMCKVTDPVYLSMGGGTVEARIAGS